MSDPVGRPKYGVGDMICVGNWGGTTGLLEIVDVKWVFHHRLQENIWAYKMNGYTGLAMDYVPESYMRPESGYLKKEHIVLHAHPIVELRIGPVKTDDSGKHMDCVIFNVDRNEIESSFVMTREIAQAIAERVKPLTEEDNTHVCERCKKPFVPHLMKPLTICDRCAWNVVVY